MFNNKEKEELSMRTPENFKAFYLAFILRIFLRSYQRRKPVMA